MSAISSITDSIRKDCRGKINVERGDISVDCSKCSGPVNISDSRCFSGLSERMLPGFRGNVILRSSSDELYTGSAVEALSASSDIVARISSVDGSLRRLKIHKRVRMKRLMNGFSDLYMRDPKLLLKNRGDIERRAESIIGQGSNEIMDTISDIFEMIERMIRRLEKDL
ncbi:MAG: hypothetical protein ACMUIG_00885 [Thermoplasmatota archaeon]